MEARMKNPAAIIPAAIQPIQELMRPLGRRVSPRSSWR